MKNDVEMIKYLKEEIAKLAHIIHNKDNDINDLRNDLTQAEDELDDATSHNAFLEQEVSDLQDKSIDLTAELDSALKEIDSEQLENNYLSIEVDSNIGIIIELEAKIEELQDA